MRIRRASAGNFSPPLWDNVAVAWVSAMTDHAASSKDFPCGPDPIDRGVAAAWVSPRTDHSQSIDARP